MADQKKIDQAELITVLSSTWLVGVEGVNRNEVVQLLAEIVDDWASEADKTPDPQTVLHFQLEDLDQKCEEQGPQGRLEVLRLHVLGRKMDRLSAKTFALGTAILNGTYDSELGRTEGRTLLDEAASLGKEVKDSSPSAELDRIRRDLSEATMEALFAVERKAMSLRLNRR